MRGGSDCSSCWPVCLALWSVESYWTRQPSSSEWEGWGQWVGVKRPVRSGIKLMWKGHWVGVRRAGCQIEWSRRVREAWWEAREGGNHCFTPLFQACVCLCPMTNNNKIINYTSTEWWHWWCIPCRWSSCWVTPSSSIWTLSGWCSSWLDSSGEFDSGGSFRIHFFWCIDDWPNHDYNDRCKGL